MDQILPVVQLVLWSILPRNVLQYDTDRQSTYKCNLLVNGFYQHISIILLLTTYKLNHGNFYLNNGGSFTVRNVL